MKKKINLTIGITVYNRQEMLNRTIHSLLNSQLNNDDFYINIRVYDDCSTEFTEEYIKSLFPMNIDYYRHEKNHGADYNMGFMYRRFLETGDDVLFNCDSDLIFDKNWLSAISQYLFQTDGVLSLFNTSSHPIKNKYGELCTKESVGNAGTVMTRQIVKNICESIDENEMQYSLDWNWCSLLNASKIKIYCTTRSYVQHIGINGFNSGNSGMDIGMGFQVDGAINGQILGDVLFDVVNNYSQDDCRNFYYLFPFEKLLPGKRVVIYGAGVVGRDYINQLVACNYCSQLTVVDGQYQNHPDAYSPDILNEIDYDFVVVAANLISVRREMVSNILSINPSVKHKIIDIPARIIRYKK